MLTYEDAQAEIAEANHLRDHADAYADHIAQEALQLREHTLMELCQLRDALRLPKNVLVPDMVERADRMFQLLTEDQIRELNSWRPVPEEGEIQ